MVFAASYLHEATSTWQCYLLSDKWQLNNSRIKIPAPLSRPAITSQGFWMRTALLRNHLDFRAWLGLPYLTGVKQVEKGGYSQNYNKIFQIFTLLVHTTLNWESNCIANIVFGGKKGGNIYMATFLRMVWAANCIKPKAKCTWMFKRWNISHLVYQIKQGLHCWGWNYYHSWALICHRKIYPIG